MKGPQFLTYCIPILDVLKENGGAGNAAEIIDKVIEKLQLPEEEVAKTVPSGESSVRNRINWARFYLSKAGLINTEKRGYWQLTQEGFGHKLSTPAQVYEMFRGIHQQFEGPRPVKGKKTKAAELDAEPEAIAEEEIYSDKLLNILKNLSPAGFEKITKRLLTEIGLHDITITGKPGDQGIDGTGIIKLNDVVNFNIVFQCKRYREVVGPHHIRDFRGAMQGRADKGLIISTGRFSAEAKKEASRDGVPPIELIDGDRLVELFEKYQIGLKPVTVYRVVQEFFRNFE
jgi:restriction system protein